MLGANGEQPCVFWNDADTLTFCFCRTLDTKTHILSFKIENGNRLFQVLLKMDVEGTRDGCLLWHGAFTPSLVAKELGANGVIIVTKMSNIHLYAFCAFCM